MKEELLHLVWKLKRFNLSQLKTTQGDDIAIIQSGTHNQDAGPDFLNATIRIANTTWVGHVEMHLSSSDWNKHNHQYDPAYNSVILHVVFEDNAIVKTQSGQILSTLVLKGRIEESLIKDYQHLIVNSEWVPCASQIFKVDTIKLDLFLERLLIERLENKCLIIRQYLEHSKNDWEYVCYKLIMKYFGLKVNNEAFETLGNKLPHSLLIKNSASLFKAESILFGQAGLLQNARDQYTKELKKEYQFIQKKFGLTPMTGVEWRFARMRPFNFPTIRIAQLASIYYNTPKVFSKILDNPTYKDFKKIFHVRLSSYWDKHYIPGKSSKAKEKTIGDQTVQLIVLNAFIPLIFTYGLIKENQYLKDLAVDLYRQLPKEKNVIIENWKKLGVITQSAAETQALIQLKTQYCDHYKCLNCQIGQDILFK